MAGINLIKIRQALTQGKLNNNNKKKENKNKNK